VWLAAGTTAAVALIVGLAPAPASAAFTQSTEPQQCVFYQRPVEGQTYFDLDRYVCDVTITHTDTPDMCPDVDPTPDERQGATAYQLRYYHDDDWTSEFSERISGGAGETRTYRGTIHVSPRSADYFYEAIDGEKVVGQDRWKVRLTCLFSAPVESAVQTVDIVIRGPNYKPPAGGGGNGGGGDPGGGGGPPASCAEAERLLLSARIRNEQAQRLRGLSVRSHQAVIELWDKAARALTAVFFEVAQKPANKEIRTAVLAELERAELVDGFGQLLPSKNLDLEDTKEVARQIERLRGLQRFFRALGPIGELDLGLKLSEALYYFGQVSYHAVLRDSADYFADDLLAKANEDQRRARTVCASGSAVARAAARKKRKPARPIYAKLPKPRAVKSFRAVSGLGLGSSLAAKLDSLLTAQDRSAALARAMREGLARARAARKAKSPKWQGRQLAHVGKLARKLAAQLAAQQRRRGQIAAALTGSARETTSVQVIDPAGLARAVSRLGVLDTISSRLRRLGLDPAELTRRLRGLPTTEFAVPSLADALAGAGPEADWAAELRGFAAALRG
jgi:hypothetical protein